MKIGDKVRRKIDGKYGVVEYVHIGSRDRKTNGELVEENYVQLVEAKFDGEETKDYSEDELERVPK